MPIYEYQCSKCGKTFEVIRKFSDAPLTVHEGCGGHVERLLSAPAFHLKGSGWYATDYAKRSSAAEVKSDSKAGSESGSKSDGKSEGDKDGGSKDAKADTKSSASESKTESKPEPAATKADS
jgi:putative FmdB family regulatory protein